MPRLLAVAAALAACAGSAHALAADFKPADTVRNVCSKCHGPGGSGGSGLFPRLAGQQSAATTAPTTTPVPTCGGWRGR